MKHAVIVLDDQRHSGEATARIVTMWDPDADVTVVRTVAQARDTLEARGALVAYVIVDLLLEPSPEDEQGETLVEWMLQSHRFSSTPVLILSAFPLMIKSLKPDIKRRVKVVSRTSDLRLLYDALKPFVESARQRYSARKGPDV